MKKINIVSIILVSLFFLLPNIKASTNVKGYITKSDTLIASAANTTVDGCYYRENGSYSSVYASPGHLHCLDSAEEVTITNYDSIIQSTIDVCKTGYYSVSFISTSGKQYNGYVCADNIQAEGSSSDYADEFTKAGFPTSYFDKLTLLKKLHPNWIFTAYKTGVKWSDAVTAESVVGMSLIQVTNLSDGEKYLSLDSGSYDATSKTYLVKEGSNWYAANAATVAYYLDPRNFLTEKEIFMFENLGYNANYQTLSVIQNIFKNTELYDYSQNYIEASTYAGNSISPVSLAARSRQEVIKDGKLSDSANGSTFKGKSVYNFYNIGATNTCVIDGETIKNPVICGLRYAYNRDWFDAKTAILEGAKIIANGYINQKQNTLYFQKWNVTNNVYGNFSNQYMTNIKAAVSESNSTYNAYANIDGLLNSAIEFIIPVYEEMPNETVKLPTSVDTIKKDETDKNNSTNE
ncbi:MAG: hypothetical protein PHQ89_04565, partial [Bacilli bacterium]|nr:hypothetical protein [Bacilli bacterium]